MCMNDSDMPLVDLSLQKLWEITPVSYLGGGHNKQWLVRGPAGVDLVLRCYRHQALPDLTYEMTVMQRLHRLGLPVPELVQPPTLHGGRTWCLVTKLPGSHQRDRTPAEQLRRGRLLAEFHQASTELADLGQRQAFGLASEVVLDPALLPAVRRYEALRPAEGHLLRWHLERTMERFQHLESERADTLVLHSDFAPWNLLFDGDQLTGILDVEATHLNLRVSDFAMSWRGCYDGVVRGYDEVHRLSDLDWDLLTPAFWAWLFIGLRDEIQGLSDEQLQQQGFSWHKKQFLRRSELFRDLRTPYPHEHRL